jgi:hypothetical protein
MYLNRWTVSIRTVFEPRPVIVAFVGVRRAFEFAVESVESVDSADSGAAQA